MTSLKGPKFKARNRFNSTDLDHTSGNADLGRNQAMTKMEKADDVNKGLELRHEISVEEMSIIPEYFGLSGTHSETRGLEPVFDIL